jgi:hypothetical protein
MRPNPAEFLKFTISKKSFFHTWLKGIRFLKISKQAQRVGRCRLFELALALKANRFENFLDFVSFSIKPPIRLRS